MGGGTRSPKEPITDEPFRLAVIAALPTVVTAAVVAANTAVVLPAATVTEGGVVTKALLSDKLISAPPVGAGLVKVTVHAASAGPITDAGSHLKADKSTAEGTVTRPPADEVLIGMAVGEAEIAFVTSMGLLRCELGERVKLAVATTPLGIALELKPLIRQVNEPFVPKQSKDLAALVALGPALIRIEAKSAGEYENVHSSPAGLLTAESNERFRATVPPTGAVAEERDNKTCADDDGTAARSRREKCKSLAGRFFRMFIGLKVLTLNSNNFCGGASRYRPAPNQ